MFSHIEDFNHGPSNNISCRRINEVTNVGQTIFHAIKAGNSNDKDFLTFSFILKWCAEHFKECTVSSKILIGPGSI